MKSGQIKKNKLNEAFAAENKRKREQRDKVSLCGLLTEEMKTLYN